LNLSLSPLARSRHEFALIYRSAATYVESHSARHEAGRSPGTISEFEMIVNRKTAKALGLAVPPSILLRADEVVE
jgi:putative ABC transport system substrate-binding protein